MDKILVLFISLLGYAITGYLFFLIEKLKNKGKRWNKNLKRYTYDISYAIVMLYICAVFTFILSTCIIPCFI